MPTSSKIRSLVCVLLALSLCAPILAIAAPTAVTAPSATLLLTRAGSLHHYARQRPSAPALCTPIPLHGYTADPGHLAVAVERSLPCSLWTGAPHTGRSPPAIS